ncbi:hypothetical protein ULMS_05280 [Patiriisocius marinistellae]|uniref:HTH araC/xylS-type domain-containing protein n=1 Tax=Patiriisocius marinistellae TaxID=2494560 RepID=A0A5J4FTM6_9FLAO|nr:helix-turn-helix domain-containing protein [Patiriisocius marinistellae]GEQ85020.1 hypothetical protein ULMS_05280 [Patiriisocius marinistellae]
MSISCTFIYAQEYSDAYLASKSDDYLGLLFDIKAKDTITAIQIARVTIERSKKKNDFTQIAIGYEQMARVSEIPKALQYLDSVTHYAINSDHIDFPAIGYLYKSYFQYINQDYDASLKNGILGYQSAKKKGNTEQKIAALNIISGINRLWGNFQKSLDTDFLALKLSEQLPITEVSNSNYLNTLKGIGSSYSKLFEPEEALHYYQLGIKKSLAVGDSIMYYDFVSKTAGPLILQQRMRSAKDSLLKGDSYREYFDSNYIYNYHYELAQIYFGQSADDYGVRALEKIDKLYEENNKLFPELPKVYTLLISHSEKQGNKEKQLDYLYKLNNVTKQINTRQAKIKSRTNEEYIIPQLVEDKEDMIDLLENENKSSANKTLLVIGLLIVSLLLMGYYFNRQWVYKKRFQKLIVVNEKKKTIRATTSSKQEISAETIEDILMHLKTFETKKNFTSSSLTLNKVAKSFGTNSTYLSKVINLKKDKNFSQYLNDLRVEYAMEELNDNPKFRKYTIKAIAQESGFKSGESFSKAFYKKYKIYPSYYLKQLMAKES